MASTDSIRTSRAPKQHPLDIAKELAALEQLTVGELRERYAELHGETTRSRHRAYLIRRIAWKLQANAEGDLSERARRRAAELADVSFARCTPPRIITTPQSNGRCQRDPRLPCPGNIISRDYKGQRICVHVTEDGFECDGREYGSLSAVAKAVSGSHVNGFHFFGLGGAQ
ncbi:MAG: DUF2924 domain-containing protein [Planctomycetaceae bacterium]